MKLILVLLMLTGCATTSRYFDGCYDAMIQQARNKNDNEALYEYQKRYAEAVCYQLEALKNQEKRSSGDHIR